MTPSSVQRPIGVFDSGIGGLSVLAALRTQLPREDFIYLADSAHTPYGEKGDAFVIDRTLAVGRWLLQQHGIKALVVACNTATAAAVEALRAALPGLPVVGVEPALKPAAAHTRTGLVGVLATRGTVTSARFARLRAGHEDQTRFIVQACDGLAKAIEDGTLAQRAAEAGTRIQELCARYTRALGRFGMAPGEIDTLVLGCTHYVFAQAPLRALVGPQVHIIDNGAAVARQTQRLLLARQALVPAATDESAGAAGGRVVLCATGAPDALRAAARHWLGFPDSCPLHNARI